MIGFYWLVAAESPLLLSAADFQRDVRPLLARKCFACHGPDAGTRQAKLRLDSFEHATGKTGGYPGIVPGKSSQSRIMARIQHPKRPMPPTGERLTAAEVELLAKWIDQGANYSPHWAAETPRRLEPPIVRRKQWVRNEIDAWVLVKLESEGLSPSSEADKRTLARRLALDLTGLPPSAEMLKQYLADASPGAYERLVDSLLASTRFGERWARVWMDLARYADTQGFQHDSARSIWPWRDWVIDAYNANMPFDEFTIKQLAGDLLPNATIQDLVATGFHRNTLTNNEGGTDDEEFRDLAVRDRTATTGQVWMGLTWGCAQCHNHKYDPLTPKEFYQLYAYFNQTEDSDKNDDRPRLELSKGVSTLVMRELPEGKHRITRLFERGSFVSPGAVVSPGTPAVFLPMRQPRADRLGLARWLVDRANPLTARVQVNRFWSRLFGRGLVETEEDFGTQGAAPSHPELLDALAVRFMESGWDVKALLKLIVTSATYQQTSLVTRELLDRDPMNILLARAPKLRLDAEMIRDQALATTGLLSEKLHGPPVMPWRPANSIATGVNNAERWKVAEGADRYRRTLYTFARRNSPYPSAQVFDAPSANTCAVRRINTNTPLQALAAWNDPILLEAAMAMAGRELVRGRNALQTVSAMFESVLMRPPTDIERKELLALYAAASAKFQTNPMEAARLLQLPETMYEDPRWTRLLPDSRQGAAEWRVSVSEPDQGWIAKEFDASSWRRWPMAIGKLGTDTKAYRGTNFGFASSWESESLWLRRDLEIPIGGVVKLVLDLQVQGGFEAWINGVPAAASSLEQFGFMEYPVSAEALAALRPGRNTLAIRAYRQVEPERGQFIDVGVTALKPLGNPKVNARTVAHAAWTVVANTILNLDEAVTKP
jgi:hypothetical protein